MSSRLLWFPVLGTLAWACSSSSDDGSGGAGGTSSGAGNSQAGSGAGKGGASAGGSSSGTSSGGASAGTAGRTAGSGGELLCPPCVPPPAPDCVRNGPCGCGPYTCPNGGEAGAGGAGELCGPVRCSPPQECCNSLLGICTLPGGVCAQ